MHVATLFYHILLFLQILYTMFILNLPAEHYTADQFFCVNFDYQFFTSAINSIYRVSKLTPKSMEICVW